MAVSGTGDLLYSVALIVYLIEETDSAGWVAAALIARIATYTLLGAVGGVIADRFNRRRLMVTLDLSRAVLMVAVGFVIMAGAPPIVVLVLVVASTALTTPYGPAGVAATPLLVPEDDLAAANAAQASIAQLAWFLGPALGAAIVAISGPSVAFFANGATFGISALLVAGIGDVGTGRRGADDDDPSDGMVRQFTEGARALRELPGLSTMTLLLIAVLFAYGIEQVVQVLVVRDRLGMDAGGVGVLAACMGAGGLIAVPFAARLAAQANAGVLLAASGLLMGFPLALLAVTTSPIVAGGLMVVEGIGNITLDVLFITMLQRACPEVLLGRVYALQDSGGALAQLAGTLCAPLLIGLISLEAALWFGGGSLVVLSLLLLPSLQAISSRTEAERVRLAPIAAWLGELGILGEASQAAHERIARSASMVSVAAGAVVFSEGDPPVDLYVIQSGTVSVTMSDRGEIRQLGAGDWFGEIGLLRGVPRTASISAVEPAELLVIPGRVFLDAVNASEALPDPLAATLSHRLSRTHPHLVETTAS